MTSKSMLFNGNLNQVIFSDKLKNAHRTTIFKNGETEDLRNY